jgi:GR25 family glycosyltransferase involved in LPS biosynthesis
MPYTIPLTKSHVTLIGLASLLTLSILTFPHSYISHNTPYLRRSSESTTDPSHLAAIANSTLGFQSVFAINFAARTDKKDTITLTSALTGFDVEWLLAVAAEDVSTKAAPPTWNHSLQSPGALGCWRAHMDAMQHIVHDHISTALILEDDADWDILLKSQLHQLSDAMHKLTNTTTFFPTNPYTLNWDLLWLGHCRAGPSSLPQQIYTVPHDPTVPPIPHRRAKWRQQHIPPFILHNSNRVIFRAYAGMCTAAYAVTLPGAQKILSAVSLTSQNNPVDVSFSSLCRGKLIDDFRCFATYPPLFGSHRAAGSGVRDSDLNDVSDARGGEGWHGEYTWDIVYPAAMNIGRWVGGRTTARAQWVGNAMQDETAFGAELPLGDVQWIELERLPVEHVTGINVF